MKKLNAHWVVRSSVVEFEESAIVRTSQLCRQNTEWARECRAWSQEGIPPPDGRRTSTDRVHSSHNLLSTGDGRDAQERATTDTCRRAPVRGSAQKDTQDRTGPLSKRRSSGTRDAIERGNRTRDRGSRDERAPGGLLSVRIPHESKISDDRQMLRLRQQCRRQRGRGVNGGIRLPPRNGRGGRRNREILRGHSSHQNDDPEGKDRGTRRNGARMTHGTHCRSHLGQ